MWCVQAADFMELSVKTLKVEINLDFSMQEV